MVELSIVSILPAFVIGLVSFFLSLCILPLVPAFLAFIAGTSTDELKTNPVKARAKIVWNTVGFVLGLAFFFSLLGVLFQSILLSVAFDVQIYLNWIFGSMIIIFGLMMSGILKIPFLEKERKLHVNIKGKGFFKSFLFGAAFAVGWTPCASPFLGLILGFAATRPLEAFPILFSYSLGLGVPFIITAFFITKSQKIFTKIIPHMKTLNFIFGILFVILGLMMVTGIFTSFVNSIIPADIALHLSDLQTQLFDF
jgi:cytochrome c-type biogenesis protein